MRVSKLAVNSKYRKAYVEASVDGDWNWYTNSFEFATFPGKGKYFLEKIIVSKTYYIYMKTVNQQHSQKMTINTRCPADELLKVKDGSSQRISYV